MATAAMTGLCGRDSACVRVLCGLRRRPWRADDAGCGWFPSTSRSAPCSSLPSSPTASLPSKYAKGVLPKRRRSSTRYARRSRDRSRPTLARPSMARRWTGSGSTCCTSACSTSFAILPGRPATCPSVPRSRPSSTMAPRSSRPARRGALPIARSIRASRSSPWDASSGARNTSATSCATTSARCCRRTTCRRSPGRARSSSASSPMRPASSGCVPIRCSPSCRKSSTSNSRSFPTA